MNNKENDSEVLEKFTHSILKDMKSLESNTSQLVDKHFWDLVQNLKNSYENRNQKSNGLTACSGCCSVHTRKGTAWT